jgi:hypothetical protein
MARQYGVEKVHLVAVLALVAEHPGATSAEITRLVIETFRCARRAAIDAISILRKSGCIEPIGHGTDRRRLSYYLTDRGWWCLVHPAGGILLRYARRLFTTCGATRVRRMQDRARDLHGDLDTAFRWAAASLQSGNHAMAIPLYEHRLAIEAALVGRRRGIDART